MTEKTKTVFCVFSTDTCTLEEKEILEAITETRERAERIIESMSELDGAEFMELFIVERDLLP